MERKKYLELCKQNAIKKKSATVFYGGNEYYPFSYDLGFNKLGKVVHTCVMEDKNEKSFVYVGLEDVQERLD